MGKNSAKKQVHRTPNALEAEAKALAGGIKNEVVNVLGKGSIGEAFNELLGGSLGIGTPSSEAPKPQEEKKQTTDSGIVELFVAKNHKGEGTPKRRSPEAPKAESRQEAAMNYSAEVKNNGEKAIKKQHKTDAEKVNDLKNELNQIAKSSAERTKVAPVTLNQDTRRVGKSDVGFLELTIKSLRTKTEDSNEWLKVGKSKNGKKGGMDLTQGKNHVTGERTTIQNSAG